VTGPKIRQIVSLAKGTPDIIYTTILLQNQRKDRYCIKNFKKFIMTPEQEKKIIVVLLNLSRILKGSIGQHSVQ
jgi:hypothetical protein